jgi:hypothetical protein
MSAVRTGLLVEVLPFVRAFLGLEPIRIVLLYLTMVLLQNNPKNGKIRRPQFSSEHLTSTGNPFLP